MLRGHTTQACFFGGTFVNNFVAHNSQVQNLEDITSTKVERQCCTSTSRKASVRAQSLPKCCSFPAWLDFLTQISHVPKNTCVHSYDKLLTDFGRSELVGIEIIFEASWTTFFVLPRRSTGFRAKHGLSNVSLSPLAMKAEKKLFT